MEEEEVSIEFKCKPKKKLTWAKVLLTFLLAGILFAGIILMNLLWDWVAPYMSIEVKIGIFVVCLLGWAYNVVNKE